MTPEPSNGDRATIREVYALIDKRGDQILAEMRAGFARIEAEQTRSSTRVEGIATRLDAHAALPGHPELVSRLTRVELRLAKWAGGLAVLGVLLTLFSKFIG